MNTFYFLRHCKAAGQEPGALLTSEGEDQARALAINPLFRGLGRIISSPFLRATQSVEPLAKELGFSFTTDPRLEEFQIGDCAAQGLHWLAALKLVFEQPQLSFPNGETTAAAKQRALAAIAEVERTRDANSSGVTLFVTHGALLAIICSHYDRRLGFEFWQQLKNPNLIRVSGERVEEIEIPSI